MGVNDVTGAAGAGVASLDSRSALGDNKRRVKKERTYDQ
jgi:hypothetical protein